MKKISNDFEVFNDSFIKRFSKKLEENKQIFSNFLEKYNNMGDFSKLLDDFKENIYNLNTIMILYDYPPIDHFSIDILHEFSSIEMNSEEINEENMNKLVGNYFDEHHVVELEKSINNWNIYDKEKEILINALEGYKQEYYDLVIPTLIARLEGLVYNSINYSGKTNYGKLTNVINKAIDNYIGVFSENDSEKKVYESVKEIYKTQYRSQFVFGLNNNETHIKRHSIMHGNSLNYGTKENAVKLFLQLEYIYGCLDSLNEVDRDDLFMLLKRGTD